MSTEIIDIALLMEARAAGFEAFDEAETKLGGVGAAALAAGAVLGGALVAGVAESVKQAGQFQTSMTQLVTGAGELQSNLSTVSNGILDMAGQVGESTQQLSSGMYMIESAGFHGADGLQVLKAAAEGAKVGNADLGVTANAVTTALKDYHLTGGSAVNVTNDLVATVALGKTHMQDLAGAISKVLPEASNLGIKLPDVSAALAVMTSHGIDAARAGTSLQFLMQNLAVPSKAGADALKSVGLSAQDLTNEMKNKGLEPTLETITTAVGKKFPVGSAAYNDAISKMVGGQRGLLAMLSLTGSNMGEYKADLEKLTSAYNKGGKDVIGWSLVQGDFNFQLDRLKDGAQAASIKLGIVLLPIVTQIAKALSDALPHVNDFITAIGSKLQSAMDAMSAGFAKSGVSGGASGLLKGLGLDPQSANIAGQVIAGIVAALGKLGEAAKAVIQTAGSIVGELDKLGVLKPVIAGIVAGFVAWRVEILGAAAAQKALAAAEAFQAMIGPITTAVGIMRDARNATEAWTAAQLILDGAMDANPVGVIVVAIGVLIGVIALLVTHWKQVTDALDFVKEKFLSLPGPAKAAIAIIAGIILMPLLPIIALIAGIVLLVKNFGTVKSAVEAFGSSILQKFQQIGAAFKWLYDHNTYVKQLVDSVVSDFNHLKETATTLAGDIRNFATHLSDAWHTIGSDIGKVKGWFTDLPGPVKVAIGIVTAVLFPVLIPIAAIIAAITLLATHWSQVWSTVSGVIKTVAGVLFAPITNAWNSLNALAGGWPDKLVGMLAGGIKAGAGKIRDAVIALAQAIVRVLGFHSPPQEGPAHDADQWAPSLIKMFVSGLTQGIAQVAQSVAAIATAIKNGFGTAFSALADFVRQWWPVILMVIPGMWMIGLIALILTHWSQIKQLFTEGYNFVRNAVQTGWSFIQNIVNTAVAWLWGLLTTAWNREKAGWQAIFAWVQGVAASFWNWVRSTWQAALDWVWNLLSSVWNRERAGWQAIFTWIQQTAQNFWNWVRNLWQSTLDWVWNLLSSAWNRERSGWQAIFTWVQQTAQAFWNWVKSLWQTTFDWIWNLLSSAWNRERQGWQTIFAWVQTTAQTFWNWIKNLWQTTFDWVWNLLDGQWNRWRSGFTSIFSDLKGFWNTFSTDIQKIATDMVSALSTSFGQLAQMLGDDIKKGLNAGISLLNGFISGVTSLLDKIPGFSDPLKGFQIKPLATGGTIPALATGGDIPSRAVGSGFKTDGPTFIRALVGEGNQAHPEYVLPSDPVHRLNAQRLWVEAGKKIGAFDEYGGQPPNKAQISAVLGPNAHAHASGGVMLGGCPACGGNHTPALAGGGSIPTSGTGGQCLAWVAQYVNGFGGIPDAKDAASKCNSNTPKPGEVFIDTGGPLGHAGFVYDATNVLDSNWGEDEKIRIHPLADVQGYGPICYVDTGKAFGGASPSGGGNPLADAAMAAIKAAEGPLNAAVGKIGGLGGMAAQAVTSMIEQGIESLVPSSGGNATTGGGDCGTLPQILASIGWNPTGGAAAAQCIASHESGCNPAAKDGTGAIGLFQIQTQAHPNADPSKLTDATYNAGIAKQVYDAAGGWGPWTTHSLCGLAGGGLIPGLAFGGMIPAFCQGGVFGQGCGCSTGGAVLPGRQHTYDDGGMLMPGLTQANNQSGQPEAVLTSSQWSSVSQLPAVLQQLVQQLGPGGGARPNLTINVTANGDPNQIADAIQRRWAAELKLAG